MLGVLAHCEQNELLDTKMLWHDLHHVTARTCEAMIEDLISKSEYSVEQLNQCFHILGFDVLLDQHQRLTLLEVNNGPSLRVDSIYPTTGPAAIVAYPEVMNELIERYPDDAKLGQLCRAADASFQRMRKKPCKCMSLHRPHWHTPCAVDLVIKSQVVDGAMSIVRKMRAGEDNLTEGSSYDAVETR